MNVAEEPTNSVKDNITKVLTPEAQFVVFLNSGHKFKWKKIIGFYIHIKICATDLEIFYFPKPGTDSVV